MSLNYVFRTLANLPGWHTNRKIVVIESDDWGSIRMPSVEVYQSLMSAGIRVDKCPYNRYDSLASQDDLQALFEVLRLFKDKNGNHPLITANTVVANPDFDKIKASGFQEYHYEPFTKTLERYPRHGKAFGLWQQGIREKIFWPQFHGREHVNVRQWMSALQSGEKEIMTAFAHKTFGINTDKGISKRHNYMAALDYTTPDHAFEISSIVEDGLHLFEEFFGFRSKSFIATNYLWGPSVEKTLFENGVRYIQGIPYQYIPSPEGLKYNRKLHYTGQKNKSGQVYLVRNAFFEPSLTPGNQMVDECLSRINLAFTWRKPAIIGSHRINFIGSIVEKNRTQNLKQFRELLHKIITKWPDVEFLSSDKLGEIITS